MVRYTQTKDGPADITVNGFPVELLWAEYEEVKGGA